MLSTDEMYEYLLDVVAECSEELDELEIPYSQAVLYRVNTRAKRRWGNCRRVNDKLYYDFEISINSLLFADGAEEGLKNTVIHEMLHTTPGGHGHKGSWLKYAKMVNAKYGYNIKRIGTADEKGVDPSDLPMPKYKIRCTNCAKTYYRHRTCRLVEHPELFRCGCCHQKTLQLMA